MNEINEKYPLILVFYFDEELFKLPEILTKVVESVEKKLEGTNTKAFFLRCNEGQPFETITCINPIQVEPTKMEEINKLIGDIKKQFDISQNIESEKCNCNNDELCMYCNR